ncbi:damage-inducible type I toxin DinQ [Photorhabdus temperata]|nr:damage-inducible type I toxin DinQ [Photorhabdus temperata]
MTGSVRVSIGVLLHLWSKRMGAFIDKVIIVLKALIALLELIRIFFA